MKSLIVLCPNRITGVGFARRLPARAKTAENELVYRDRNSSRTNQSGEGKVKRFMLLHFGFEKPTPEIMAAWNKWFESVADRTVDQGGFSGGKEISDGGTKEMPWGMESITGYSIINAESIDEAEKIARENPYIASIRVYEIREH